jgi:hypothetical protein
MQPLTAAMNNNHFHIERLQASNIHQLNKLHMAVYNRQQPEDFFVKKYNTAYTGVMHIGFIAFNDTGMAVAFYGVIPCFLQHAERILRSAQSADTMTHPQYRNQGLFVKLANLTFNLCKANGIQLVFGFPNQNSLPGFINKLGWVCTDTMDCFVIPANRYNLAGYLKKIPVLKGLYRIYVDYIIKKRIDSQFDLGNPVLNEGCNGVQRTIAYLTYKQGVHPTHVIEIQQSKIWLKINNGLMIGDIILGADNFDVVMPALIQLAKKLGLKQVLFHCCPGTALHQLFRAHYSPRPSFPVIFKDLGSGLPLSQFKFTTADIDIF